MQAQQARRRQRLTCLALRRDAVQAGLCIYSQAGCIWAASHSLHAGTTHTAWPMRACSMQAHTCATRSSLPRLPCPLCLEADCVQAAPNADRHARQAGRAPAARAQPRPVAPQRRRRVLQVREPAVADHAVDAGRGEVDRLYGFLRTPCIHGHASLHDNDAPDHADVASLAHRRWTGRHRKGQCRAPLESRLARVPTLSAGPLLLAHIALIWWLHLAPRRRSAALGRARRRLGQQHGQCLPCHCTRTVARACRNATLVSPCALALRSARPCMLSATSTPTTRPAAPTRCAASSAVLPALGRRACDAHERRHSLHQQAGAAQGGRPGEGAARHAAAAGSTCVGSQVDHERAGLQLGRVAQALAERGAQAGLRRGAEGGRRGAAQPAATASRQRSVLLRPWAA